MSLFSWFLRKSTRATAAAPDRSSLGHLEATTAALAAEQFRVKSAPPPGAHPTTRKAERLQRREQVYSVVRDAMTRAGVCARYGWFVARAAGASREALESSSGRSGINAAKLASPPT